MIGHLRSLFDRDQRRHVTLLFGGLLAGTALEILALAAIPAFITLLTGATPRIPPLRWVWPSAFGESARSPILAAAALAVLFLVKNLYLGALAYAEGRVTRQISTSLASRLYAAYLYRPYTFHLQRNPAELINTITIESGQVIGVLQGALAIGREALVLTVFFVLLLIVDPFVSLAVFLLLGTTAGAFLVAVRRTLGRRGELMVAYRQRQSQVIGQGLGAIREAKLLGREPFLLAQAARETDGRERQEMFRRVVIALPRLFLETVAPLAVLLVAVVFVALGRPVQTMLPVLTLLAVAVVRLVPAFSSITLGVSQVRYGRASLDIVATELAEAARSPRTPPTEPRVPRPFETALVADGVHYRYPSAEEDVLEGVSLTVHPGEAIALVGPTGSGKTTIVDLLLGLLSPTRGRITVDGSDLQRDIPGWQRQIGYVPQDIYLVDDTIRRNVAFGLPDDQIDEAAVALALEAAQLATFVADLPQGLDTSIGHRGIRLSGGQRQRIGIARALYHDPSVLVMDEATSALDGETERNVIDAIGRLRGDRTMIIVAHRLSTVRECDRLYLIDQGRVADVGTFDELALRHESLAWPVAVEPVR